MDFIATLFFVSDLAHQAAMNADNVRWHALDQKVKADRIERAFALFRSNGIEPILIKGWAAALNYPSDSPRSYNDTDIAVAAQDYSKAARLTGHEKASGLIIDLHRELRHYDCLPWQDLLDNSRLVRLGDNEIRILCPEDHLRVLCVHWLNDGGADRERLWDIYYAVSNRSADFDWKRCVETVPKYRRKWILTAIGIAHYYLGLPIDDLPFAAEAKYIPDWIRKCVEAEWASDTRLEPVIGHLRLPASLFRQLMKRLPPNPLRAIIEMEGRIDSRTRIFYQIGCAAKMLTHPRGARPAWVSVDQKEDE